MRSQQGIRMSLLYRAFGCEAKYFMEDSTDVIILSVSASVSGKQNSSDNLPASSFRNMVSKLKSLA